MARTTSPKTITARASNAGAFRIGYVPLVDAAPLIVAEKLGLFTKYGVTVRLSAELGWGSIREKIVYSELEAAHAPGPLLFSILLGTHARACAVSTDLVLNLQGNAITLSQRWWKKGVRDSKTFKQAVRSEAPNKPVFAVVSRFSSHQFLLAKWLRGMGIDPVKDVRIAILPPPLVVEHMVEGQIDGFCSGEPWNSNAALKGDGWVVATSSALEPRHPEKVLMARNEILHRQPEKYAAIRSAIIDACRFCELAANRSSVVDMLMDAEVFPGKREVLENSLIGPFNTGVNVLETSTPFFVFNNGSANVATRERAQWCLDSVTETGALQVDGRTRKICLDAFLDDYDSPAQLPTQNTQKSIPNPTKL